MRATLGTKPNTARTRDYGEPFVRLADKFRDAEPLVIRSIGARPTTFPAFSVTSSPPLPERFGQMANDSS